MATAIKTVAVIGAGTMGNGIAHVFAQNGFSVQLVDLSQAQLDKALASITKNLDRQLNKASITAATKQLALKNLHLQTNIAAGVKNAQLVIIPHTGHLPHVESFDQFIKNVNAFIKQ